MAPAILSPSWRNRSAGQTVRGRGPGVNEYVAHITPRELRMPRRPASNPRHRIRHGYRFSWERGCARCLPGADGWQAGQEGYSATRSLPGWRCHSGDGRDPGGRHAAGAGRLSGAHPVAASQGRGAPDPNHPLRAIIGNRRTAEPTGVLRACPPVPQRSALNESRARTRPAARPTRRRSRRSAHGRQHASRVVETRFPALLQQATLEIWMDILGRRLCTPFCWQTTRQYSAIQRVR